MTSDYLASHETLSILSFCCGPNPYSSTTPLTVSPISKHPPSKAGRALLAARARPDGSSERSLPPWGRNPMNWQLPVRFFAGAERPLARTRAGRRGRPPAVASAWMTGRARKVGQLPGCLFPTRSCICVGRTTANQTSVFGNMLASLDKGWPHEVASLWPNSTSHNTDAKVLPASTAGR